MAEILKFDRLNPLFIGFLAGSFALATSAQAAPQNQDKQIDLSNTEFAQLNEMFPHHPSSAHQPESTEQHAAGAHRLTEGPHQSNHEADHDVAAHHNGCGGGNEGSTRKFGKNNGLKYDALFAPTYNEHVGFLDTEARLWTDVRLGKQRLCVMPVLEFDGNPNFFASGGNLPSSMLTEGMLTVKVLPNTYAGVLGSWTSKRAQFDFNVGATVTHILKGDWRIFAHYAPNGAFARVGMRGLMPGEKIPVIKEVKFLREADYDLVLDCNTMSEGRFQKPVCSVRANINKRIYLTKIFGKNPTYIGCGINNAAISYRTPSLVTCNFKFELGHG